MTLNAIHMYVEFHVFAWIFQQCNETLLKYKHITLSYSTKVGQNEGIITLFSPTVFSDDVFDGYEKIFVVYCHLVMDKTLTAS